MADEGDIERMVFLLEARTNELEKGMKRADAIANKAYAGMKRGSKTATQQMEADMMRSTSRINQAMAATSTKIGTFGKNMLAGFAGGLVAGGIAGIVSRLGQVASGVASIGDEAKRAGLSVKAFQELKYVAEQNRIGVDALTDGIKELNLRADEFIVTGGGSAAEAFKRLGYSAEELNTKLQDPSALFTEIIGKLQHLDRAAQIRIADELFGGTGGEKFVQLIEQGEDGIRRTIDEAHNLGIVLDADVIAKAAEVDRKFNQIANTIGSGVKGAIVSATSALLDFLKAQDEAIRRNRLMAMDADAQNRHRETIAEIEAFLDATARVAPEAEARVRELVEAVITGQKEASEANEELRKMGAMDEEFFPIAASLTGLLSLLDQLVGRSATARQELASLGDIDPVTTGGAPATWDGIQSVFFPKPTTKPGSGGGGRSSAASEAERQAKAIQNLIAGLEFEKSLIGLSALEQAKLNALRQAGAAATEQQKQQIISLIDATYAEQAALDAAEHSMQAVQDVGVSLAQSLGNIFSDGKVEAEEFLQLLGKIAIQMLTMPMGGGGNNFLGNIFGAFVGGLGFSSGTANTGGQRGEPRGIVHGQEAVIPLPSGGKVPVQVTGGGSQRVHVTSEVHVTVDDKGAVQAYVAKTTQQTMAAATPYIKASAVTEANKQAPSAIARYQQQRAGGDYRTM